jgi:hypothetical protein
LAEFGPLKKKGKKSKRMYAAVEDLVPWQLGLVALLPSFRLRGWRMMTSSNGFSLVMSSRRQRETTTVSKFGMELIIISNMETSRYGIWSRMMDRKLQGIFVIATPIWRWLA